MIRLSIALICSAITLQPAQSEQLQKFQFRQLDASLTYDAAVKIGIIEENCSSTYDPKGGVIRRLKECATSSQFGSDVGTIPFESSRATFDQAGFVGYDFSLNANSYTQIRELFRQKYGQPCSENTSQVSVFGLKDPIVQHKMEWCFSDGTLSLSDKSETNPSRSSAKFVATRWKNNEAIPLSVNF